MSRLSSLRLSKANFHFFVLLALFSASFVIITITMLSYILPEHIVVGLRLQQPQQPQQQPFPQQQLPQQPQQQQQLLPPQLTGTDSGKMVLYQNASAHFQILYPDNWQKVQVPTITTNAAQGPTTKSHVMNVVAFRPTRAPSDAILSIAIQPLTFSQNNMPTIENGTQSNTAAFSQFILGTFANSFIKGLALTNTTGANHIITKTTTTTTNNLGISYIMTLTHRHQDGRVSYDSQIFLINSQDASKVYLITSAIADVHNYRSYLPILNAMISSIGFL